MRFLVFKGWWLQWCIQVGMIHYNHRTLTVGPQHETKCNNNILNYNKNPSCSTSWTKSPNLSLSPLAASSGWPCCSACSHNSWLIFMDSPVTLAPALMGSYEPLMGWLLDLLPVSHKAAHYQWPLVMTGPWEGHDWWGPATCCYHCLQCGVILYWWTIVSSVHW